MIVPAHSLTCSSDPIVKVFGGGAVFAAPLTGLLSCNVGFAPSNLKLNPSPSEILANFLASLFDNLSSNKNRPKVLARTIIQRANLTY